MELEVPEGRRVLRVRRDVDVDADQICRVRRSAGRRRVAKGAGELRNLVHISARLGIAVP